MRIGAKKNGKSLLVDEVTFPLQNVTINLYKIVRGWWASYPEPLGRIGLGRISKLDEKKDPILIQAQKDKEEAEKKAKEELKRPRKRLRRRPRKRLRKRPRKRLRRRPRKRLRRRPSKRLRRRPSKKAEEGQARR